MLRKYLFVVVIMLPLLSLAQQKRTIMISSDSYNNDPFTSVFRYITTPFHFIDRIFDRESHLVNRLHNRLTFTFDRHSGFTYRLPIITDDDNNRIILNDKRVIILPRRELLIDNNRNGIIIQRNGHTIYISRDRKI